jgi:subtilase family serine protease
LHSKRSRRWLVAIAFGVVAALAWAVAANAANPGFDYVANPPHATGPSVAADAHSLPSALTPPTCDFGGGNVFRCYTPGLLRRAYDFPSASTLNGAGQTILIFDAYGSSSIQQDLAIFDGVFGLPAPPSFQILCPIGCSNTQQAGKHLPGNWAVETSLDVEYAHAMAPGANIVLALSPSSSGNTLNSVEAAVLPKYPGAIVSQSFGVPEALIHNNNAQINQAHQNYVVAQSLGDTVLASTGDFGATNGVASFTNAGYPASDPLVTAVGGTQGHPYPNGLLTSGLTYGAEEAWNEPAFGAAGGGAVSELFAPPSFQSGLGFSGRAIPDVSYNAALNGGVLVIQTIGGQTFIELVGGTSAGSPQWASIIALADQARGLGGKGGLGYATPALYGLGGTSALHDIVFGNNALTGAAGFSAGPGYDLATGLGTPDVTNVINALK